MGDERINSQHPTLNVQLSRENSGSFAQPGNPGLGDLLGCETVADDFEKSFDFFDGYPGAKGERSKFFPLLNGSGFVGFDSFTAEFGAELLGHGGEDGDGEGAIVFLEDGGFHNFSRFSKLR